MQNVRNEDFKREFKKRCFLFSLSIIHLERLLNNQRASRVIYDQLLRSGTSIGANVVEGGNSTSKREFINFFQIALKSASETLYWLALLKETDSQKNSLNVLITECSELKKLLATVILNTKSNSKL